MAEYKLLAFRKNGSAGVVANLIFGYQHMYGNCGFDVIHNMCLINYSTVNDAEKLEVRQLLHGYLFKTLIGTTRKKDSESENFILKKQVLNSSRDGYDTLLISESGFNISERTHKDKALIMTDVIEHIYDTRAGVSRILGFYEDTKDSGCWTVMNKWVHNPNHDEGRGVGVLMLNPPDNPEYEIELDKLTINGFPTKAA